MDNIAQEALDRNLKVYALFNPYYNKEYQIEISYLEQIAFYHRKNKRTFLIGEFVRNIEFKPRIKKKIIKDLLKYWEKDFKKYTDVKKTEIINSVNDLKKYKIKKIELTSVSVFLTLITASLILLRLFPEYNNYFIILVYLALIAIMYNMFLFNYFDEVRNTKSSVRRYINDEFRKINRSFKEQQKLIKRHLYKTTKKIKRKEFEIKKIFDVDNLISKLMKYAHVVENKVIDFKRKYLSLIFLQYIFLFSVFGLSIYITYIMVIK